MYKKKVNSIPQISRLSPSENANTFGIPNQMVLFRFPKGVKFDALFTWWIFFYISYQNYQQSRQKFGKCFENIQRKLRCTLDWIPKLKIKS